MYQLALEVATTGLLFPPEDLDVSWSSQSKPAS
jgi:hypothetical protein